MAAIIKAKLCLAENPELGTTPFPKAPEGKDRSPTMILTDLPRDFFRARSQTNDPLLRRGGGSGSGSWRK